MSLKDVLALIDDKLEEVFHRKPHDPSKARKPVLKRIAAAKTQFENGSSRAPNRWWSASNDVVAFKPVIDGKPLLINGKPVSHVPAERFPSFLDKLTAAVEAGELDKEIEALNAGTGSGKAAKKGTVDKFPADQRTDWDKLDRGAKQSIGRLWGVGKNPDGTPRALVGDKPNAPYQGATKKK
ncbi:MULTISPECIES: hypothetical protein [unclassified Sphingobium]|uniref:hypothetical protein n=1 Tax=unclassified Sphingobium TaxID=2611147 RepID=UPI002225B694|nr:MULTISPECIES: hypothetical protein [unclassified Sphingobium]MCW2412919.1 hypothetical protein [Sphingobium sp. B8D3D]MCW2414783.1 hypothetical protein [Sphingobium sp. B8D3A]